ncbi:MAG: TetR/AcrR family transcriptional regulator [Coprococcus sp.]
MNVNATSKEDIMRVCRQIAARQGLSALNMRAVARECHIALGTLYNYYSDKDELLIAAVESVWKDIFHMDGICEKALSFSDYVCDIFNCMQKGAAEYPNFLSGHSISIAKSRRGEAKSTMEQYFEHMKSGMLAVLRSDQAVDHTVFSQDFTESDFIDFVLDNLLLFLIKQKNSCTLLVELVRRIIYQ